MFPAHLGCPGPGNQDSGILAWMMSVWPRTLELSGVDWYCVARRDDNSIVRISERKYGGTGTASSASKSWWLAGVGKRPPILEQSCQYKANGRYGYYGCSGRVLSVAG